MANQAKFHKMINRFACARSNGAGIHIPIYIYIMIAPEREDGNPESRARRTQKRINYLLMETPGRDWSNSLPRSRARTNTHTHIGI